MAEEAVILRGGCQCGAVRYEARAESGDAYYCHCRMCQKAFGHLSSVFCGVDRRGVEWERGEPAYFQSSKVARRGFCRGCGTPLTFEYLDSDELHLAVGSLDEPGRLNPVAHYGSESIIEPFFTEDGLPRERTEDGEEFVAKWRAAHGPGSTPGPLNGA
ncbi:MAG TPA: GFA family protein [Rubrobacter sp.]|nr:GFA family protein [Rubrobacter sp.]